VQKVLAEIGADNVPQLLVFNKLDALDEQHQPLQMQDEYEQDGMQVPRIFVSAKAGVGLHLLRTALATRAQEALGPVAPAEEDVRDLPREYPGDSD
jgi:GTP-binding protein HflX